MYKRIWFRKGVALLLTVITFISIASTDVVITNAVDATEEVGEDAIETVEIKYENEVAFASEVSTMYEDVVFEESYDYSSKTLLVQLESKGELEDNALEVTRVEIGNGFYVLTFATEEDTKTSYQILQKDENVEAVEIDAITSLTPTSVMDGVSESLVECQQDVHGFQAYLEAKEESDIPLTIALIDTGVDGGSGRIKESISLLEADTGIVEGSEGVYKNHGEALADLLVTCTTNNVSVLPITAFNDDGIGTVLSAYLAIITAIEEEVDVINLSFSGAGTSSLLSYAIEQARNAGIIVVVAAGNDGGSTVDYMPANISIALTVGAVDSNDIITSYSNTGSELDLVAYESYEYDGSLVSGTSVSSAYVSAAAALLVQEDAELRVVQLETLLCNQAIDLGSEGKDVTYGYGKLSLLPVAEAEQGGQTEEVTEEVIEEELGEEVVEEALLEAKNQVLSVSAITSDPSTFYWSATLGNQGKGMVEYEGEIYWCNRANLDSNDSYTYNNKGWYVQLVSDNGKSYTFYIEKTDCLWKSEEVSGYGYYIYKIERRDLAEAVEDAGYSVTSFFADEVDVELDGYVEIRLYGVTKAGPYDLRYTSNYNSLISVMESYGFNDTSLNIMKEQYMNKTLTIDGDNVVSSVTYSSGTTDTVSNMPASAYKIVGENFTISSKIPTRTGYTFGGWRDSVSSKTLSSGSIITSEGDRTLTAIWTINTYKVSYSANGGSGAPSSQTKTYGTTLTLSSTKPTRTGYTFQGWGTYASDTSANYQAGESYTSNSAATLYAVWKANTYSITYKSNTTDTVSNMPSTQTKTYGTTLTLTNSTPTRDGYLFQGWGTYSSDTSANYQPGGSYTSNSATTLYAIWKEAYYLDLNGYLDGVRYTSLKYATADIYINGTLVSNDVSDYYKTWIVGTTYTVKDIKTEDGYGNAGATSYSGVITAKATVTPVIGTLYYLDLNHIVNGTRITSATNYASCDIYINGTKVANDVTAYYTKWPYGTTYEIKDIKSYDGYIYTGGSSYSGTITAFTSVNLPVSSVHTNDAELFAKGFVNGEGTNSGSTTYRLDRITWTQTYGTTFSTYAESTFEIPNGYYFNATTWVSSTLGTSKTYTIPATLTQEAASMSFDYSCSPYTYTITYELNDGTMEENNPTTYNVLYGVSFKNEPEKEGYSFAGWEIDGEAVEGINVGADASFSSADDLYKQLKTRTTGDITVTATWNAIPELEVEDVYMYLENELEEERILQDTFATDEEDGEITHLVMYNQEEIVARLEELRKIELTKDTEYQIEIRYEVTDEFGHEVTESAVLHVYGIYDDTYEMALAKSGYVRFIAEEYLDTLQENSKWRDTELWDYLTEVL